MFLFQDFLAAVLLTNEGRFVYLILESSARTSGTALDSDYANYFQDDQIPSLLVGALKYATRQDADIV